MVDHVHGHPVRAFDENGDPVSGAYKVFYASGTTTPATVYSDAAGTIAHASPLTSGQNGDPPGVFPPVYSNGSALREICYNASGVQLWDIDPVPSIPISSSAATDTSFTPYTSFPQTNVQAALEAVMALWNAVTTYGRSLIAAADASAARTTLGLGELAVDDEADRTADQSTWNTGTDTGENLISAAKLDAKITNARSGWDFESSNQAFSYSSELSVAHGLGVQPSKVALDLVCTTAEHGFSIGDKIVNIAEGGVGNTGEGFNFMLETGDTANVKILISTTINIHHKTTFAAVGVTASSWRMIVKASA